MLGASTSVLALAARSDAVDDARKAQAGSLELAVSAVSATLGATLKTADDAAAFNGVGPIDAAYWRVTAARLFADPTVWGAGVALVFPHSLRASVERRLGVPLQEPGAGGTLVPARRRARYVVPIYVAFRDGGNYALGVNLAAEPRRAATFARAALLGQGQLTAPVPRVGTTDDLLVNVYSPIYAGRPGAEARPLAGYVIAGYRTALLTGRVQAVLGSGVRFRLVDAGDSYSASDAALSDPRSRTLLAGGRRLTLSVGRPPAGYGEAVAVAVGGAAITALVALLLLQTIRGQRRLENLADLLGRTQEISHTGGWEYDLETRTLTWTDEVYRIYGVEPRARPPDLPETVLAYGTDSRPVIEAAFRRLVEQGEPYDLELALIRADGQQIWVRTSGRPTRENGRVRRVGGHISDVTARREAEERVRALNSELEERVAARTAELERSIGELETFAYSMSHDLRTPLRALDGYSKVLLEECADTLGDEHRWYLERLRAGAVRMGDLIDELLVLSRISRQPLTRAPVDISHMAGEVVAELQAAHPGHGADVEIQDGLFAHADSRLVRVVLENLVSNAFKFTSKTAQPRIRLGAVDQDGVPVYFVGDNGAGFDMAHTATLFRPFHRLHRESEFPGLGIGLATVTRAVRRHGGGVWAEGVVNAGATFHFTLRPGPAPPASAAVGEDVLPAWRPMDVGAT